MGAIAVVALAAACDSGPDSSLEGTAGAGGASTAAGMSSAGSDAKAGGAAAGSSNPTGGMSSGGSSVTGGVSNSGASNGGVGSAGTSAGSGGSALSQAGAAGTPAVGDGGASSGGAGGAGEVGVGGDMSQAGMPGAAGDTGQAGSGDVGCGGKVLAWSPRASNVMLLMDRSGSMFDIDSQPWTSVRAAALPVIDANDGAQNIGFMAMSAERGVGCPFLSEIAPAPANYAAISAMYNALSEPNKGESPYMMALSRAQELLAAAPEGEPFVILVIDGEPDYCDDGDDLCPIDSVVARIQLLKAAGITTLVAGLPISNGADPGVYAAALQSYANAGVGLPAGSVGETPANLYLRCQGYSSSWKAEFDASGKPAQQALGTYSASPGAAPFTSLNPASVASMTSALAQLFARTQSCSFEAKNGKVVLAAAQSGLVKLGGQTVDYDAVNGWHMKTETVLELTGSACQALRAAPAAQLTIDFPCGAVSN